MSSASRYTWMVRTSHKAYVGICVGLDQSKIHNAACVVSSDRLKRVSLLVLLAAPFQTFKSTNNELPFLTNHFIMQLDNIAMFASGLTSRKSRTMEGRISSHSQLWKKKFYIAAAAAICLVKTFDRINHTWTTCCPLWQELLFMKVVGSQYGNIAALIEGVS